MSWKQVKLGEVLELDLDRVAVDPSQTYGMVGVYSFGRGLFLREPVEGSRTSYKFFYRIKGDHLVMSQLFGWEGALALSSKEYEGLYVSPQFPTFRCNLALLERQFLGWLIRRPSFWADLGSRTRGMGDRRRTLNPESLLECVIPLPPLPEQRRIVARINQLAKKIDQVQQLQGEAVGQAKAFVSSLHLRLAAGRTVKIGTVLVLDEIKEEVKPGREYPQIGVKGFGGGLFPRGTVVATQTTYRAFNRLYEGAVVLS